MTDSPTDSPTLPWTSLTLDQARVKLTGWHFAKEALSEGEREILYVAEGLLRLLDETEPPAPAASPAEPVAPEAGIPGLLALVTKPGVCGVDVYADGIEVCGSPADSDDSAGFIDGDFTAAQVRAVVGPDLPVTDCR